MRLCVPLLLSAGMAFGQGSTTTIFTTDVNGQRQAATSTTTAAPGESTRTELARNLNGRTVPLQKTETRVLRKDSSGSLTEQIIRKYDPNGNLVSTQRIVTEEQVKPGGGSTVTATTYSSDINGDQKETERRVSNTSVSGATMTTDTSIQRPSINGSLATVEKRNTVVTGADDNRNITETVYRAGPDGFAPAVQTVTQDTKSGNQTTEHVAEYEPGVYGQLQLHSQTAAVTTTQPDGSQITRLDIYAAGADGTVQQAGSAQQIKEEQIITRNKAADGSVTETVSVRRPSLDSPKRLGNPQQISQTVCTGKCN